MKLTLLLILFFSLPVANAFSFPNQDSIAVNQNKDTLTKTEVDSLAKINSDTTTHSDTAINKEKKPYVHQIRFGFDISRIAFNQMYPSKQAYEFQVDYTLRNNLYIAAETGLGSGKVNYEKLDYTTNAYFIRLGIDKSFLDKISATDFDMGFLGVRYGMGIGRMQEADYTIISPFGTIIKGSVPSQNFVVHWAEVVGGIKVELWKGVFAGWTARGKFLLNSGVFKELSPNFIAGYGKGDKNSVFDFNFYISYSIKWGK